MSRRNTDFDTDDSFIEDMFDRTEDVNEYTADDRNDDAKMLRDEWAKLDKPHNIRETENLKK